MINIFNLFLFLCALWVFLAFTSGNIMINLLIFGVLFSLIISCFFWKLKFFNKNTNFLFLNIGFYRHFFNLFLRSFFYFIPYLLRVTFNKEEENNHLFQIKFKTALTELELSVFIVSISFVPGISYVDSDDGIITLYALNEKFANKSYLNKIYNSIHQINDDNLI